jgi:addiction module RelE/StbE family toxin
MARIRWTPQAAEDLETIADYIAHDSPHYARLFVLKIISAKNRLEQFPEIGRIVPECNDPAIRELILGSYRVVYRLKNGSVETLTVYHSARLLDPSTLN